MAYFLIVIIRIIFAPLILVWPTAAIILSLFLDIIDADFAHHVITKKQYQVYDKLMDNWVYVFELILTWKLIPQYGYLLTALFAWRIIGFLVFIISKKRQILLLFGNYFENFFFLFYFATQFKALNFLIADKPVFYVAIAVAILGKAIQEWFIHVADLSIREDFFKSKRDWKK